jgi:hypothetical protein
MRQALNPIVAKVLKRLHYPLDVILHCVRRYGAYPMSLRNLEGMMAEPGISVDQLGRAPLSDQIVAGPGGGVSALQAQGREELAHGRDIRQG